MAEKPDEHSKESEDSREQPDTGTQAAPPILKAELQIPRSIIEEYYSKQGGKEGKEEWRFWIQIGTFIIAFLALVLAGFQGYLTNEVAIETQQRAHLEQRAWLSIHSTVLANFKPNEEIMIDILYTNSGKTPAKGIKFARNFLWESPNREDLAGQITVDAGGPLAPGEQRTQRFTVQPNLPPERFQALINEELMFSLIGTFTYFDIFSDEERHTPVCVIFNKRTMPRMSSCDIGVPMD